MLLLSKSVGMLITVWLDSWLDGQLIDWFLIDWLKKSVKNILHSLSRNIRNTVALMKDPNERPPLS